MSYSINLQGSNLFKPIQVGDIELKHRVSLAPLTRNRSDKDGSINLELAKEYYDQRSKREGTLIVTETVTANASSLELPLPGMVLPSLLTDEQESRWKQVIDVIHNNQSFVFGQIAWVEFAGPKIADLITSYSKEKLESIVDDYVKAAERFFRAGVDGVEIHLANGTQLYQLQNPDANLRTDEYGGSIDSRALIPLKVIDALGSKFGYSKIAVRISPFFRHYDPKGKLNPLSLPQSAYIVAELEKRRVLGKEVAYISVIESRADANDLEENLAKNPTVAYESTDFVPAIYGGVIVRAGNYIVNNDKISKVLSHPKTFLAFGRYFISNPDLPDKLEKGYPLNPYNRATFYSPGSVGYIDYPEHKA